MITTSGDQALTCSSQVENRWEVLELATAGAHTTAPWPAASSCSSITRLNVKSSRSCGRAEMSCVSEAPFTRTRIGSGSGADIGCDSWFSGRAVRPTLSVRGPGFRRNRGVDLSSDPVAEDPPHPRRVVEAVRDRVLARVELLGELAHRHQPYAGGV